MYQIGTLQLSYNYGFASFKVSSIRYANLTDLAYIFTAHIHDIGCALFSGDHSPVKWW